MEKYFFINHLEINKDFSDSINSFVRLAILHNIIKNHKQREDTSGFYCVKDILQENSNDFYTISSKEDLKPFELRYEQVKIQFINNYMLEKDINYLDLILNTNDFWLHLDSSPFGLNSLKIAYPSGQDDYSFSLVISLISTKGFIRNLLNLKHHINIDNTILTCNLESNFYTTQNGKVYSCIVDASSTYMIREEILLKNSNTIEKAINHKNLNIILSNENLQKELIKI